MGEADWQFKTTFEYNSRPLHSHAELVFEGLDTYCDIRLVSTGLRVARLGLLAHGPRTASCWVRPRICLPAIVSRVSNPSKRGRTSSPSCSNRHGMRPSGKKPPMADPWHCVSVQRAGNGADHQGTATRHDCIRVRRSMAGDGTGYVLCRLSTYSVDARDQSS